MSSGRFLPTCLLNCSRINMPVICTAWKSKGNENFAGNQDTIYDWLWMVKFWIPEILYKIKYLIYYYYYYLYYIYKYIHIYRYFRGFSVLMFHQAISAFQRFDFFLEIFILWNANSIDFYFFAISETQQYFDFNFLGTP